MTWFMDNCDNLHHEWPYSCGFSEEDLLRPPGWLQTERTALLKQSAAAGKRNFIIKHYFWISHLKQLRRHFKVPLCSTPPGWVKQKTAERMDGRMGGWTDGRTDGGMDGCVTCTEWLVVFQLSKVQSWDFPKAHCFWDHGDPRSVLLWRCPRCKWQRYRGPCNLFLLWFQYYIFFSFLIIIYCCYWQHKALILPCASTVTAETTWIYKVYSAQLY